MALRKVEVVGGGPAGLFAARLLKERFRSATVRVSDRTVPDETFGFGVGFTSRTLRAVAAAAPDTFQALLDASVPMPEQEFRVGGSSARSKGSAGGIAIARARLLNILMRDATDAGVETTLGHEVGLPDVRDADLVVAADGVSSSVRTALADHLDPRIEAGRGLFMWLGCAGRLTSNLFAPVVTEHGVFTIHAYPHAEDRSTVCVETDPQTWRRAGMEASTERTGIAESDGYSIDYLQRIFGEVLGGAALLGNRSRWASFRTVSVRRWHHENVVLIGDAAHTAHYSVGSGTKMAMEDAIALADALDDGDSRSAALRRYERRRRPRVATLQELAARSRWWWESLPERLHLPPAQLMLAYLSRGGVVSADRVRARDHELLHAGLSAFAGDHVPDAATDEPARWALSMPYRGPSFQTAGRVIGNGSSPTAPPHLDVDADVASVRRARARQPGAVVFAVLHTAVTDPWGADATDLVARCRSLREAGADGVRLDGPAARAALLDRLAVAERVRLQSGLVTVVSGPDRYLDDLADGVLAQRVDLVSIQPRG